MAVLFVFVRAVFPCRGLVRRACGAIARVMADWIQRLRHFLPKALAQRQKPDSLVLQEWMRMKIERVIPDLVQSNQKDQY